VSSKPINRIKKTSYGVSPSMEAFDSKNCNILEDIDTSHSNQGHHRPKAHAMIATFDLKNIRSCPGITKNGSMHSSHTQWSTDTTQTSNMTKRQPEKIHKKRNFHSFVKTLMRIVKEKDEGRFRNAKAVIRAYEQQKKRGEIDSLSESLCCPLKDAVGPKFWKEALDRVSATPLDSNAKKSPVGRSKEFDSPSLATKTSSNIHHKCSLSTLSTAMDGSKIPNTNNHEETSITSELGSRKKRLWMVIRVFMQYLRSNHVQLYKKAHTLVNECARRHKRVKYFENNASLSLSIQACFKKEFGLENWRRAEQHVDEILSVRKDD